MSKKIGLSELIKQESRGCALPSLEEADEVVSHLNPESSLVRAWARNQKLQGILAAGCSLAFGAYCMIPKSPEELDVRNIIAPLAYAGFVYAVDRFSKVYVSGRDYGY